MLNVLYVLQTSEHSSKCMNIYRGLKPHSYSTVVHRILSYATVLCALVLQILNTLSPQGHAHPYLHFLS